MAINVIAAYAILALLWLGVMHQFIGVMAPRLDHLGASGAQIIDRPCGSPECDFSAFWPAGLLARAGLSAEVYQPAYLLAYRRHLLSSQSQPVLWFYPPPSLLPPFMVSYLPFEIAFLAWSITFAAAAAAALYRARLAWQVIALALLSPAALWNFEMGQFGVIMGGLLVAGLLLVETAPVLGGAMLGLLILKPPYALLIPFIVVAKRNWRAMVSGAGVVAAMLALTTILLGWRVWEVYLSAGLAISHQVLNADPRTAGYEQFGTSIFWMLRYAGAGLRACYAVQLLAAIACAWLAWRIWRRDNIDPLQRMALAVFLSLLASPYGYTDDMVAWSVALAALAWQRNWRIGVLDALFWLWPMLSPVLVMKTGLLLTPIVVAAATARTWHRAGLGWPHLPRAAAVLPRAG